MALKRLWQQAKNLYHWVQAQAWRAVYGWPDRDLDIYGITGTNGKTTTAYILAHVLREAYGAEKVGLLTTIVFWIGGRELVNETKMTTLPSREVFRYLKDMRASGVKYVVLEVTSHALDQHRLSGLRLCGAIILNVSREHLDYHDNMKEYAQAKQRVVNYLKPGAPLVGKDDDAAVHAMLEYARLRGVSIYRFTGSEALDQVTPLLGGVNKENALAVAKLAGAIGISPEIIQKGISQVTHVPGRMEWAESSTGVKVLIDYAVTPDALERVYKMARELAGDHKLYGVLGACGCRDRGKRPDMARTVAKYVDELVITREDPWTEPEEQIFNDLENGLKDLEKNIVWQRIVNRREALAYFIAKAQSGDIIVATGKGAERGMAIGHAVVPWHERTVVEELFKELKK